MTGAGFDAIVLAGGRGSRLGGVEKALVELEERPLVERVVLAARAAGAERVVVVGPPETGRLADRTVREDPPLSGPLAALGAGLAEVRSEWALLLACDLVRPAEAIAQLAEAVSGADDPAEAVDAVVLTDAEERPQWLSSAVRADALRAALDAQASCAAGSLEGLPLRAALVRLRMRQLPAIPGSTADIDTPEQLALARASASHASDAGEERT